MTRLDDDGRARIASAAVLSPRSLKLRPGAGRALATDERGETGDGSHEQTRSARTATDQAQLCSNDRLSEAPREQHDDRRAAGLESQRRRRTLHDARGLARCARTTEGTLRAACPAALLLSRISRLTKSAER